MNPHPPPGDRSKTRNRDVDEDYRDEQLNEREPRLVTRVARRARIGGCGAHAAHRTLRRGADHHRRSATWIERTRRLDLRKRRGDGVPPELLLFDVYLDVYDA